MGYKTLKIPALLVGAALSAATTYAVAAEWTGQPCDPILSAPPVLLAKQVQKLSAIAVPKVIAAAIAQTEVVANNPAATALLNSECVHAVLISTCSPNQDPEKYMISRGWANTELRRAGSGISTRGVAVQCVENINQAIQLSGEKSAANQDRLCDSLRDYHSTLEQVRNTHCPMLRAVPGAHGSLQIVKTPR